MDIIRTPSETRPARMEPLARLPVFLALDGKRALVAGGSAAAAWKAELLSAAGARVEVYADTPSDEMLQIASDPPRGAIAVNRRGWTAEDLHGAAVAIGAFEDDDGAAAFAAAARAARRPGQCDRQAGVLRFRLRRHRQPFSLGHRHFHRRRRAGVRASDPRQAGSAAAEGLCRLGRRRRALALGGEGVRPVVLRPAQVLAAVHRACGRPIPTASRVKAISNASSPR